MTDRHRMMVALIRAAREFGWRVESTESLDWRVTLVLSPPLAVSRPDRNRWPGEPEEREEQLFHIRDDGLFDLPGEPEEGPEPSQVERERQEIIEHVARVADIDIGDVEPEPPSLGIARCQHVSPSPWGQAQCALPAGHTERHSYDPQEALDGA